MKNENYIYLLYKTISLEIKLILIFDNGNDELIS